MRLVLAAMMRGRKLALLFGLVLAVPAAAAGQQPGLLPAPSIRSNPAWYTVTTGPTSVSQQLPPQLFAITPKSEADALVPFGVFEGLKRLDAKGALIWATTIGKVGHPFTFRRAAWPPHLRDFRIDRGWEGQPLVRIQQRLLAIAVGVWNLDVRVYFGTQHPGKLLLASVQAELGRLLAPAS
jgi:hypothetical protein